MAHKIGKGFTGFKHTKKAIEKLRQIALKRFKNPRNHPMYGIHRYDKEAPNFGNFKYDISKKELYNLYWNEKLSMIRITKLYNCSYDTIRNRLLKYNIKIRTCLEANKLSTKLRMKNRDYKGKNNPRFIDGRSYEPYSSEFNNQLKEDIRKRDNYTCQGENCLMTEKEHIIIYGRVLEVHHIDYDKFNCGEDNLITSCKECNSKANSNRDYWFAYFTYIMEKKLK